MTLALAPCRLAGVRRHRRTGGCSRGPMGPKTYRHQRNILPEAIPFLGLAPLVAILIALRNGAPEHPARAGAAAGLFAGAIGAALYAMHCPTIRRSSLRSGIRSGFRSYGAGRRTRLRGLLALVGAGALLDAGPCAEFCRHWISANRRETPQTSGPCRRRARSCSKRARPRRRALIVAHDKRLDRFATGSSGTPITAHSFTPGSCDSTSSTWFGKTLKPETRIMSLRRSTMVK